MSNQPPELDAGSIAALHASVDGAVHKYLQSKKNVGLAVGVIAEGESQSFFYGSKASGGSAAPDENTLFEIGSITKVFTTTVLADMHLKKEVDLNGPVNKYLPASARLQRRDGVDVTLRHLRRIRLGCRDCQGILT